MADLRVDLTESYFSNQLLEKISDFTSGTEFSRDQIVEITALLHNEKSIDIIKSYQLLRNDTQPRRNFFSLLDVMIELLPKIEYPTVDVMEFVIHLAQEAGRDGMRFQFIEAFRRFCVKDVSRASDGIKYLIEFPEKFVDLLCPLIISGSENQLEEFLNIAIQLSSHDKFEIRKAATFSLGRIQYRENQRLLDLTLIRLEVIASREAEDSLRAQALDSGVEISLNNSDSLDRLLGIAESILRTGGVMSLHVASTKLRIHREKLSKEMLGVLFRHLVRVDIANKGTIENIDFGISALLQQDPISFYVVEFLENLILSHNGELPLASLEMTSHQILASGHTFMAKLFTRWLSRGDFSLCHNLEPLLNIVHGESIHLGIEQSELLSIAPVDLLFIARKAVGYLLTRPITLASIIISIMKIADDLDLIVDLADLLYDPLLLNFPGTVTKYIASIAVAESGQTKEALDGCLAKAEIYYAQLKEMGELPELHPSQRHREAYSRYWGERMAISSKDVRKESVFANLFTTQTLLYGRGAINYIQHGSGQSHRMEIPLKPISVSIEIPRRTQIDQFGFKFTMAQYRAERKIQS
jgi:hypothetical protein